MEIDVHKLDAMRKAGEAHTLLDIREIQELDQSAVEGALHIAMSELLDRLDEVPKEQPLVVMCHVGGALRRWCNGCTPTVMRTPST